MATLCRYTYDALDRVSSLSPLAQALANRFYCAGRLATELQGNTQQTLFHASGQMLAQLHKDGDARGATLMAVDNRNSVLHVTAAGQQADIAYTPYGHREPCQTAALPGFTGAQPEPVTGHYLLGNGYRAFNPVLMRFNSPDTYSPFGEGGLNAYGYCMGDPVNRIDPTGHIGFLAKGFITGALLMISGATSLIAGGVVAESNPELSKQLFIAAGVLVGTGLLSMGVSTAVKVVGRRPRPSFGNIQRTPSSTRPDSFFNSDIVASSSSTHDAVPRRPPASSYDPPPPYDPPPSYADAIAGSGSMHSRLEMRPLQPQTTVQQVRGTLESRV